MSTEKPSCLLIGAGGVGVITAYSLFHADRSNVSMVVRSDYSHIVQEGYKIDSCDYGVVENWKPHQVFKNTVDAARSGSFFDYIVVTVKNIPDGPIQNRVHEVIRPVIESNHDVAPERRTSVLLIQNGIDIEKEILECFDKNKYHLCLLSGVQLIASTKLSPGYIHQKGLDHLIVGAFNPQDALAVQSAKDFVAMYNNEGHNHVEFDPRVRYTRWKKLLYNAAINTTTALVGLDVPRCLQFSQNKKGTEEYIFRPAMREIIAIAASEGITLESELVDFFVTITQNIVYKPSMCVDIEKGQLMELEIILGNPIRIAAQNEVPTPTLSMLYHLLTLLQGKVKEKKGLIHFDEKTARLVDQNNIPA
ncbi:LAFE_0B03180g1_1 [Lachancea fermentati]|uniref:LAFE_0B03180g1_1 n=1 Tax=Lachancea fermentati TaxID=4955 RepID=A0A1G4M7R7_LACFM|nr:LAFE_0B03180g1_1 [Lachancea fermentati]